MTTSESGQTRKYVKYETDSPSKRADMERICAEALRKLAGEGYTIGPRVVDSPTCIVYEVKR